MLNNLSQVRGKANLLITLHDSARAGTYSISVWEARTAVRHFPQGKK